MRTSLSLNERGNKMGRIQDPADGLPQQEVSIKRVDNEWQVIVTTTYYYKTDDEAIKKASYVIKHS